MRVAISIAFWISLAFAIALTSHGQYSEIDHSVRQIELGVTGIGDSGATTFTGIFPYERKGARGWIGLHSSNTTLNGKVVGDIRNLHIELGKDVRPNISLNAFAEWNTDKELGLDREMQVGGFLRGVKSLEKRDLIFGLGNFLVDEQARADLELKETDDTVVRWLFYVSTTARDLKLMFEFTPQLDFSDFQTEIEPKYLYHLNDQVALLAAIALEYDSQPLVEDKHFSTRYSLKLTAQF